MEWKKYRNNVGLFIFIAVFLVELILLCVILIFFSHFIIIGFGIIVLTFGMFVKFLFTYITSNEIFTKINFDSKEINDLLLSIEAYYGEPIYSKNNSHIVKRYYKNGKCFIYKKMNNILIIRESDKLLLNYDFNTKNTIFLDNDDSMRNVKYLKTNNLNLLINIILIIVFITCYVCLFILLKFIDYSDSILMYIRDSFIYWIIGLFILSLPVLIYLYLSYRINGESIIPKKYHVGDNIESFEILSKFSINC